MVYLCACSVAFTGYSDVTLTGECITDDVLHNISRVNGVDLADRIGLAGGPAVLDAKGPSRSIRAASGRLLEHFVLEDTGAGVVGTFVPVMLQVCRQLETLHIGGAEAFVGTAQSYQGMVAICQPGPGNQVSCSWEHDL